MGHQVTLAARGARPRSCRPLGDVVVAHADAGHGEDDKLRRLVGDHRRGDRRLHAFRDSGGLRKARAPECRGDGEVPSSAADGRSARLPPRAPAAAAAPYNGVPSQRPASEHPAPGRLPIDPVAPARSPSSCAGRQSPDWVNTNSTRRRSTSRRRTGRRRGPRSSSTNHHTALQGQFDAVPIPAGREGRAAAPTGSWTSGSPDGLRGGALRARRGLQDGCTRVGRKARARVRAHSGVLTPPLPRRRSRSERPARRRHLRSTSAYDTARSPAPPSRSPRRRPGLVPWPATEPTATVNRLGASRGPRLQLDRASTSGARPGCRITVRL